MYYQILNEGNIDSPRIEYSDNLAMVYSIRSFDGKYTSLDTIANHYAGFLGQFSALGLPKGLQSGIYNILKHKGGAMRLLIPSHLAYGVNGFGSGSSGNVNGRIAGNQCLDYFVRIVDNQDIYDKIAIKKYLATNSLSGYNETPSGLFYKITGSDTGAVITQTSKVTVTYKLQLLNKVVIQEQTASVDFLIDDLVKGAQEGLKLAKPGQTISLLIPSNLGYGRPANTSGIPGFSCLVFDFDIKKTVELL
ncbi:MAG: FKBP-type peptidyl-prolyl cis-trans isomerase, partial [Mucilaginibacter sp.]